jgi:hypothetical protein
MADIERHAPAPSSHDDNVEVRHEHSDVNVRGILWFVVGLTVSAIVIHIAVWGLFEVFARRASQADPSPAPLAVRELSAPPEPRLQGLPWQQEWTTPRQELTAYRDSELRKLQSYGWIDRNTGVVHIPIDRAIEIMAQRGSR